MARAWTAQPALLTAPYGPAYALVGGSVLKASSPPPRGNGSSTICDRVRRSHYAAPALKVQGLLQLRANGSLDRADDPGSRAALDIQMWLAMENRRTTSCPLRQLATADKARSSEGQGLVWYQRLNHPSPAPGQRPPQARLDHQTA